HQWRVAGPRSAGVVADRCDPGRPDVLLPDERLGIDDDRRDDPRRRRLPRAGCRLQAARGVGSPQGALPGRRRHTWAMPQPVKTVGAHFDEWAPRYDAQIREMVPRYEEVHDTLVALLALHPPRRFLDLGA